VPVLRLATRLLRLRTGRGLRGGVKEEAEDECVEKVLAPFAACSGLQRQSQLFRPLPGFLHRLDDFFLRELLRLRHFSSGEVVLQQAFLQPGWCLLLELGLLGDLAGSKAGLGVEVQAEETGVEHRLQQFELLVASPRHPVVVITQNRRLAFHPHLHTQ